MNDDEAVRIAASARRLYGAGERIWAPDDRWNQVKSRRIDKFGQRFAAPGLRNSETVIDAGSGRDGYGWIPPTCISIDLFEKQVIHRPRPVVASIEALPFRDSDVDFTVCVGAVINYASAAEAIAEIARVTKPGGGLLLHFETSTSFEHVFTRKWDAPVVRIDTVNSGRRDTIWVYRPAYIDALLRAFGFVVRHRERFHVASAAGLRLGMSQQAAARLAVLDGLLRWAGHFADDIILLAEKVGEADGAFVASANRRQPAAG